MLVVVRRGAVVDELVQRVVLDEQVGVHGVEFVREHLVVDAAFGRGVELLALGWRQFAERGGQFVELVGAQLVTVGGVVSVQDVVAALGLRLLGLGVVDLGRVGRNFDSHDSPSDVPSRQVDGNVRT